MERKAHDLKQRYGDCYAVVSGATSDLGEEFCNQLAA